MKHIRVVQLLYTRYPLAANVGTSVSLFGFGDLIEQRLRGRSLGHVDWGRVSRMSLVGFVFGPLNHGWYTFLDRVLRGRTLGTIVRKVLADQLVFAPTMICSFFITICTLEGVHVRETMKELQLKFWSTYMVDCTVWPVAQVVNFSLVPQPFRVLYVNLVTLGWNTFLSYMRHSEVRE
jgi:protein Mpv17